MKLFRFGYVSAVSLFLLSALFTGKRELFMLFFMGLLVMLFALVLNLWTVLSFSYVQELEEPAGVKGSQVRLRIRIHNDKPFPFTLMRIRLDTADPSDGAQLSFNLSPYSSFAADVPLRCSYRGLYPVGMTTVEVCDVFGLFRIRYDMRRLPYYRQRLLKVYPRLITLPFLPSGKRDAKSAGGNARQTSLSGESYADLRRYRPGDPLTRVHWPATARQRELMVKRYDLPTETAALIAVDNEAAGFEGEDLLRYGDLACECACAIAHYCTRSGYGVELLETGPRQPRKDSFQAIYEALAVLPFGQAGSLTAALRERTAVRSHWNTVYVLTSRPNDALAEVLAPLIQRGTSVKCLFLSPGAPVRCDDAWLPGAACAGICFGDDITAAMEKTV